MKCNKLMKNLICICLFALAVLFVPQSAYANDNASVKKEARTLTDNIEIENEFHYLSDGIFVYQFTEDKTAFEIVKLYDAPGKEVVIPNTRIYGGVEYPVKVVAENAFAVSVHGSTGENIEKITIPSNIEIIEDGGFANLFNLKSVVISKNSKLHTIGDSAFYCCRSLTTIKLPNSVTSIGKNAFSICEKLEKITLPSKLKTIKEGAFKSCTSLKSIKIPNSVTNIGKNAFYNCDKLKTVTLSSKLQEIKEGAFYNCKKITSIKIPKTVTSIGKNAFYGCEELENVTLHKGLKKIGDYAFSDCDSIVRMELPSTLTSIGKGAFESCLNLMSINIPSKIKELKSKTFYGCNLEQISIPKNLKKINANTFYIPNLSYAGTMDESVCTTYLNIHCSKDSYFYKNQKKWINKCSQKEINYVFTTKKMPKCCLVTLDCNGGELLWHGSIYTTYDYNNFSFGELPYREGYYFKGWYTKKNGGKVANINSPSIKLKGDTKLYARWTKAKTYTVGNYKYLITSKNEAAFAGMKNKKTTKVYIPNSVKIKGKEYYVTSITANALKNQKKITYVKVGCYVKCIGKEAFRGCSKLSKIEFDDGRSDLTRAGANIFKGIKSNAKIYIKKGAHDHYVEILKNKGQGKKVKFKKY